jgi:hypothetical protein
MPSQQDPGIVSVISDGGRMTFPNTASDYDGMSDRQTTTETMILLSSFFTYFPFTFIFFAILCRQRFNDFH